MRLFLFIAVLTTTSVMVPGTLGRYTADADDREAIETPEWFSNQPPVGQPLDHGKVDAMAPRSAVAAATPPPDGSLDCPPMFWAGPWKEADLLFHRDRYWIGGNSGYSVDLGNGRVLWLFANSIIDPTGARSRDSPGVEMVSNTVGIQRGYDPSTAEMSFYWRTEAEGHPAAFFPDIQGDSYWPGHGIRIRDRLILFLMRVKEIPTGIGFEVYEWDAVLVRNPDADPPSWEMTWIDSPERNLQIIIGSATVLSEGGYVYAYSTREPSGGDAYLVRWPERSVYDGDLRDMEWWAKGGRWVSYGSSGEHPTPVLRRAGTEFTVHPSGTPPCYMQVQTVGFGPAVIAMRTATGPTGPWSSSDTLYRPREFDEPEVAIYQGKAHPHLTGADLVLTYSTSSFEFQNIVEDTTLYYPRFVRLFVE